MHGVCVFAFFIRIKYAECCRRHSISMIDRQTEGRRSKQTNRYLCRLINFVIFEKFDKVHAHTHIHIRHSRHIQSLMIKTPQFWRHLMLLGVAMALVIVCLFTKHNITLRLNVFSSVCAHTHIYRCLSVCLSPVLSPPFPLCPHILFWMCILTS